MNNYKEGPEMKNKADTKKAAELHRFIVKLTEEYTDRLKSNSLEKRSYHESLSEWEEKLTIVKQFKADNTNLFSPNNRSYNYEEVVSEINQLQQKIQGLDEEDVNMNDSIEKLTRISELLEDKEKPKNEVGLSILESQEKDRQRIARDLHDSTVQNLTGLVHKIELCSRLVELDPIRARLELTAMTNTVKSIINEIREIIYNLKPMSLDDLGLAVTVERYAKQLMMSHDIKVYVKSNQERENILPVIKLSLFRVVQEACHNVIKHANAGRIDINIHNDKDSITVTIKDDGEGFDSEKQKEVLPERTSGYGLSIMNERIYLLSGSMKIHSEINKGTIITINVPLTNCKGEENEQTD
jgi:two-component system sensor histidine kinase DegS